MHGKGREGRYVTPLDSVLNARVGRGRMGQAGKMGHFKWLLSMTSRVNIF